MDDKMLKCSFSQCVKDAFGYTAYGEPICRKCVTALKIVPMAYIHHVTFSDFSQANKKRCESPVPNGFGESLDSNSEYDAEHWALAVGEEAGEVLGAVLGMTGRKARKKHLTKEDVFKEIGDTAACLDLLAQRLGSTLGECMVQKFNEVSDRIGSDIKL